ncbi:putative Ras GTPase-activating protein-binding protein [Helianthus anomalus]
MPKVSKTHNFLIDLLQQIHKLVQSLPRSQIEIKVVNSVESGFEGIMVVVLGSVKYDCFSSYREFVQPFFLLQMRKRRITWLWLMFFTLFVRKTCQVLHIFNILRS